MPHQQAGRRAANRPAYLGTDGATGEKPRVYGHDPRENCAAIVERHGKNNLVFLLPAPHYESTIGVLER